MTKYSSEFKAKVANEYLQGDITYQALAKKYHVGSKSSVECWVAYAVQHGLVSEIVKHRSFRHSQEFKLRVVKYAETHEVSQHQVAIHFAVSDDQVDHWIRDFRANGATGLRTLRGGVPSMVKHKQHNKDQRKVMATQLERDQTKIIRLEHELQDVKMQRDILKVLATLTKESHTL